MKQKIVILGAGFAGLRLVKKLSKNKSFDITIIDKYNYHQFQPLLYQVASAGLEPSAISFPLRKALHKYKDLRIRLAEVLEIDKENNKVITNIGDFGYDKLIIALGANTNFFGNTQLAENCLTMKSVPEALLIRNELLSNYERATTTDDLAERDALMNIIIVGGGATGVELAGAIAEMKNTVLQKDYPELDLSRMNIHLIEAGGKLLSALSEASSQKTLKYLTKLGVDIMLNTAVKSYDGTTIETSTGVLQSKCVIWAAGIKPDPIKGIGNELLGRGGRIMVDEHNRVMNNIYAIGDIALMTTDKKYPNGHPQVAPVAVQQADNLATNFAKELMSKALLPFKYKNQGSMATVGRNLAVVELPKLKFGGFPAWLVWMFVHLMSIVGVQNRMWIFFNWLWQYITYDMSLRLIINQAPRKKPNS